MSRPPLAPPPPRATPSSPCTRVCVLGDGGLCEGCGRTRDEIVAWGGLSEPQRRAIMAGLPERLRRAGLSGAVASEP